jgi:glutamate synthase domain-containing protein 3
MEMVGLFKVSESAADSAELRGYVEAHAAKTGSHKARALLADWDKSAAKFVKVLPHDYARAMAEIAARAALNAAASGKAQMA